jgi:hypothetical protein
MPQALLPLIHKAKVQGLLVQVARSGLSLGDEASIVQLEDGRIGILARIRVRILGLVTVQRQRVIGHFGPQASDLIRPELDRAEGMRLRVVGVTPEFLAGPDGAEVHVSVWVHP